MTNAPTGFLWREWTHCVFYKHKPQNEYPKIIPKITTVSINPKIRHNTMWFFLKDEEMIDYRVSQNCDKKPGTARCTICSQIHCCISPLWQEAETIRRSTLLFNISLLSSWQEEEETIIGGVVGKRSPQAQGTYITWTWEWFWFYGFIPHPQNSLPPFLGMWGWEVGWGRTALTSSQKFDFSCDPIHPWKCHPEMVCHFCSFHPSEPAQS